MTKQITKSVTQLAREANAAAAASQTYVASVANSVGKAIEAGKALNQAKEQLPHGDWGAWMAANFKYDARWGRELMLLAKNEKKIAKEGPLSIREALKILDMRDEKKKKTPKKKRSKPKRLRAANLSKISPSVVQAVFEGRITVDKALQLIDAIPDKTQQASTVRGGSNSINSALTRAKGNGKFTHDATRPDAFVDDKRQPVPKKLYPVWRQISTITSVVDRIDGLKHELAEANQTLLLVDIDQALKQITEVQKALQPCVPTRVEGEKWYTKGEVS